MSHVITCSHITQNFYEMNKKRLVNLNPAFQCVCNDTCRSHRLYFCVCVNCYKDLVEKKECSIEKKILYRVIISLIEMINTQGMKFCTLRTSLDSLNFRGNMRFFSFRDIIKFAPIFWCYRYSLIFKK